MKQLITIILLFCASLTFAQVQPQRPDQNGQFNNVTMDRMTINKGLFRGKAMEIMGTKEHNYLIPSSKAVYDFLMGNNGSSGFTQGSGNTGELAIWRADTLYGDPRIKVVVDTVRMPRTVFVETQGTIEPSILSGINSLSSQSLLQQRSPLNAFWARDEGDGDWVSTFSVVEGNIILQEMDGGADGEPRIQFYSARADVNLNPIAPIKNDDVFYLRGIKHKGLNTNRDIYANGAGIIPLRVKVDTIYGTTNNLGFRLELGGSDNVSGVFSGNADITMFRTGDLRFRTYTTSRNDSCTPTNFLSTNNLGDLRANPLSDIIATGTFVADVGNILAGGITEIGPFTISGVVVGKPVDVGVPTTFEAGLMVFGYASAANQVKVRIYNPTVAPIDPINQTYSISQVKL